MDDSRVGVATTLSKEEQWQQCLNGLLSAGALATGHPFVEGSFLHSQAVIEVILKLEGKLVQAEAERDYRTQEWARVLTSISGDVIKGEAELKALKEKLAGYEAADPDVRALHAECQQVKARLHAFEQRYGSRADMGVDIVYQYNSTISHHRELEGRILALDSRISRQAAELTKVTEEKDEALREILALKEHIEGLQELSRLNTQSRRGRKKKV